MLTPAQQKVKQELEELQLKALVHQNEQGIPDKKLYSKKWIYIIVIVAICAVTISSFILLLDFSTDTQEEIASYLEIEQGYAKQSAELFNEITEKDSNSLQESGILQAKIQKKVHSLAAPASLREHKSDLLDVIQQRRDIISYLTEKHNNNSIQLNKKIIELSIKEEMAADSLLKAFDREKIQYDTQEDGTVQYRVNSATYQY
ncbi:hypothetical protein AA0X95_06795 [Bacillus sp. 1P10SD]|uniref:hypothetical protein n=1 Tax=Bacillus sp. 1P10SD TaxID=3132265 RepID=UPI0039A76586